MGKLKVKKTPNNDLFARKSSTHDRYITNPDKDYYSSITEASSHSPNLPLLKDLTTLKSKEGKDRQQGGNYLKFNLHLPTDVHSQISSP